MTALARTEALCRAHTELSGDDISLVLALAAQLQTVAELVATDTFIDCLARGGDQAVIVAEARPQGGVSLYRESVVGKMALPALEPGVFATFRDGVPFHGLRAVTQENIAVRQDIVPLKNAAGRCVAVLIREKDVTERLTRNKKYASLLRTNVRLQETVDFIAGDDAVDSALVRLKETDHRIKNNLQMLASIMNLEARRAAAAETGDALRRNADRILTIAAIHDMLNKTGTAERLALKPLLQELACRLAQCAADDAQQITICVRGDEPTVSADIASALALAVNELLMNAIRHAFPGRAAGHVDVVLSDAPLRRSVTVEDDGVGFAVTDRAAFGLGLQIVEIMARDKLNGFLRVRNGSLDGGKQGASVCIEF